MTFALCFAIPVEKLDITTYFSNRINFRNITKTTFGRSVLGNRLTGNAFLLSVYGMTDVLIDRGPRSDHSSQLFRQGVSSLKNVLPSISFLLVWMNLELWENEHCLADKVSLEINEFEQIFPSKIKQDVRYIVKTSDESYKYRRS